ncbi:MAG: 1-deoxy-D-xylulose-5-phosphate synthase, partial [Candidatus Cloacimonas sp.]|nr:1-deoxy-D-xylulose-5-phosphate synthase [Candidatus Cloacimonas sp.]
MILEKITDPKLIHGLKPNELILLAKEVRARIVEVVSQTGGHLAPSLGAVDLTIALLNVFDPLKDRIVWDVGHQSYGWKILTGRNAEFATLRQLNGISGFTNRDESPYDAFSTGHSSTSISAALGIACARDLKRESGHCVAVIGDGALTGGISFEALNHSGHLQKNNFIVILNDNAMSISKNVGGLQRYMARMMASRSYNTLKQQIWDLSGSLPSSIRRRFIYGAQKLEESMMNILVPNIIFEDLGFKYVGPIDGHDIERLLPILSRVKDFMVGPVLIHVVTQKGKGYAPAEKNASLFHGIGPFEAKSGKTACSGKESWSEMMGKSLIRLAESDDRIVAITAAMAAGTGLSAFEQKFPERFFDVGIAEQHAVTLAAGMASKGMKPFVAIYSTFMQRALDQVIHDCAMPRLPVVFCIDRAGLVGEDGATHHGAFDIAFLSFIPNLVILSPENAEELSEMLAWAAAYTLGPIAIRYPRGTAKCIPSELSNTPFDPFQPVIMPGVTEKQPGKEAVALICTGDAFNLAESIW